MGSAPKKGSTALYSDDDSYSDDKYSDEDYSDDYYSDDYDDGQLDNKSAEGDDSIDRGINEHINGQD